MTSMRTGGVFFQILVTTRNPFLDVITKNHSLSSADSDVMKNYKLRLGKLKRRYGGGSGFGDGNNGERAGHVAFGPAEQVDEPN
ncbi:3acdeea4-2c06-433b-9827-90d4b4370463-CDS [Sclerotinia trifoliorum]|uniref:3acdeea4-2c06-433b-9827-90d4b4370463-CDS n=1 Tax=Sclerotinia trifoliorum TaxID=28548 RepID=A0A8H2VYG6_9HELO|nr:3acdeea4-2c06-433b-9827-90d4b4370463-CDS [Sclerotinia trifoliorum]